MVPSLVAGRAPSPGRVFLVAADPPYEWYRNGVLVRRDHVGPGWPVLIRARLCGVPCRLGPDAPELPARPCGSTSFAPATACAVLYGGPFDFSSFSLAAATVRLFAQGIVTQDFLHGDPRVQIRDWRVQSTELLPLLQDGRGSQWPFTVFRWWWSLGAEPPFGTWSARMTARPVLAAGGAVVGEQWEPSVRLVSS